MTKRRKQDFLSQEPLKKTARGVTLYLAPRVGGRPIILNVDRVSGHVEIRKLPAGAIKIGGKIVYSKSGKIGLSSKPVKTSALKKVRMAKKLPWKSETIQRLAGRVR